MAAIARTGFRVHLDVPVADARTEIFRYIEGFYNCQRLHSSLGYRSPEASLDYRPTIIRIAMNNLVGLHS